MEGKEKQRGEKKRLCGGGVRGGAYQLRKKERLAQLVRGDVRGGGEQAKVGPDEKHSTKGGGNTALRQKKE